MILKKCFWKLFQKMILKYFVGSDGVCRLAIRHQNANTELLTTLAANCVAFRSTDIHILVFYFFQFSSSPHKYTLFRIRAMVQYLVFYQSKIIARPQKFTSFHRPHKVIFRNRHKFINTKCVNKSSTRQRPKLSRQQQQQTPSTS